MIKTVIKRSKEELERDDNVCRIINNCFNEGFGELYNLLDLIFDDKQAGHAKGLIGGMFGRVRRKTSDDIISYLNNKTASDEVIDSK